MTIPSHLIYPNRSTHGRQGTTSGAPGTDQLAPTGGPSKMGWARRIAWGTLLLLGLVSVWRRRQGTFFLL